MWVCFFALSLASMLVFGVLTGVSNALSRRGAKRPGPFPILLAGTFVAVFFLFMPIHLAGGVSNAFFLSIFRAMQVFALGADFSLVQDAMPLCDTRLRFSYQVWGSVLYALAPVFTFGFVLSLFKNISAYVKYMCLYSKKMYIFSALNEKSLALATDIHKNHRKAGLVFNNAYQADGAMTEQAKRLGAVCFKKDILAVNYGLHSARDLSFFTIGKEETENLDKTLELIARYRKRKRTHVYVLSSSIASELLLTAQEKGEVRVRRVDPVRSLIGNLLYEQGNMLFTSASLADDGLRDIVAVVIGLGTYGSEMVKALTWFCQMDGYRLCIETFDKDPLAEEKFAALAPELMAPAHNGVFCEGEAQYTIRIHAGCDVQSAAFAAKVSSLPATYVFVSLGSDDSDLRTAVNLRTLFARAGRRPLIQAVLRSSRLKKALTGIKNYRGQAYDIDFIGDTDALFAENVIIDSALEADALQRHLKWGSEADFWAYEYNYRSSVASAIHRKARIQCGIPGADKTNAELTAQERHILEVLEHRRWNAYMRTEGYVYSGSPDPASRNDLAKTHHNLTPFTELSEADKRKDSRVGSR